MKNNNILIAFAILFVVCVVAFTFLAPHFPFYSNPDDLERSPEFSIPQLTEQELNKLGPKNGLAELDWLPSNGMCGVIAHPKRLLESPLLANGQDLIVLDLMRLAMIPINMKNIELFLSCITVKQVQIPVQPGQPITPEVYPMPFVCHYIQLAEPLDKQATLNLFVPPNRGLPAPRMRTVAGKEVYDLPAGFSLATHALVFLDEKTVLYVMGDEEFLQDALDGKSPTGPLADRMGRAKISDTDIVFVGSAEAGLPQIPPEIIENFSKNNGLSETLAKRLWENFRAIQLILNFSASENDPLLTLKLETLKPEGAQELAKTVNEEIVVFRSSLRMPQPGDSVAATEEDWSKLGSQILDSVEISTQESIISATFRHFTAFSTYVSEFFQNRRRQLANLEAQQQQEMVLRGIFQQINPIRRYMIMYHDEHGHFPPAAICDAEGNPLLSWRVAILPYMGERELYSQFKWDEPWDGPTNRPLIGRMPAIFGDVRAYDPTRTTVRLFNSEGTPFGRPTLRMPDILGPQTTIMLAVVSPENAVEWTRPDTLVPCTTVEEYIKLFGPMVPILLFDGNNIAMPFDLVPEQDHPMLLERFKNMIEGKPIQ